jgi:hypothetical protein
MMFVLAIMAGHSIHVVDVQGAFLNGEFENDEKIYMVIPKGFERFYDPETTILLLVRTLYGLIQAAVAFGATSSWLSRRWGLSDLKQIHVSFLSGRHMDWSFGWLWLTTVVA